MSQNNKFIGDRSKFHKTPTLPSVIKHYDKPTRFEILKDHRFLISIPLVIINTLLLIYIYLSDIDNHQAFINHTLFFYLPITLLIVGWLIQSLLVVQRDLKSVHYKRFENLFIQMIDACALCEIVCDEDGQPIDYIFLNVNEAFEKSTGLKIDDVLDRPVSEVLPGAESYWIQIYGRVALTGEGVHFENYSQSLNKYFEVTAFATGYHQFAIVFADITDKKMLEQRKTELEIEKSKNSLLTTVLSNLSHDFRTPISIINTSLYLIERLDDPVKRSEKIKQIKSQAELFERFIKDVISILNLEYTSTTNKTSINVNDILKDISNTFTRRMQKSGQTLNINVDFNIPDIEANPNQMAQVFSSLVENAVNFTDDGGLINLSTFMKDGDIHVVVEDNGIGMNSQDLPRIFDKFYRVDKARSHKSGGLGLGLSIVKKIIDLHNFKITISSVKDKGTKVDIVIPPTAISKRKNSNTPPYVDRVIESAKIKKDIDRIVL